MYGYIGDSTPDSNSLRGIGAFAHTSKPGSLVAGYSAALTDAEAARRGLKPGDEFQYRGKTYRYDDRQPGTSSYVDVYTPNHPPDAGVSEKEIARQSAIAAGRPNITPEQLDVAKATTTTVKKSPEQLDKDTTYQVDANGEKHDTETGETVSDESAAERALEEQEVKKEEQAQAEPVTEPKAPPVRIITPQPAITFGMVPRTPISPGPAPAAPPIPIAPIGNQNA